MGAYIFNDYRLALKFVEICRPIQNLIQSMYIYPVFLFYDSLVLLAMLRDVEEQENYMNIVKDNVSKLEKLSESVQENYLHKCYLILAEIAVTMKDSSAMSYYEKAIALSKQYCFPQEEAISCERAAMFLLSQDLFTQAYDLLKKAYNCYDRWGATSKKVQLRKKYPSQLGSMERCMIMTDTELQVENRTNATVSLISDYTSSTGSIFHESKRTRFS